MKRTLKKVSIFDVRLDGETQSRVEMDPSWIQEIVELMKNDVVFPAVEVRYDGVHYWLSDGFHRCHAYKQLGIKEIDVLYLPGTQFDAQVDSYSANGKHGKRRTRADKIKSVESALQNPLTKDKSDYELAKICDVSRPFVAAVRNPKAKEKQQANREKSIVKKAKEIEENSNPITSDKPVVEPNPYAGQAPDDEEIKAAELALQADQDAMYKILESDDALKTLHDELKRVNHLNAQLEIRLHGLMNERNEAVKMVKKLQRENDKLKGKK
jgi:hypothetical protein